MSEIKPLLIGLMVVQAAISASLWVLDAVSVDSTAAFALLLAVDVLIFAGICHLSFFADEEAAERAMPLPSTSAFIGDEGVAAARKAPDAAHAFQPLIETPTVLSRNIRLAVPAFSIAMLLLLAVLVGSGRGSTDVFIPIFILMVVVYVFSSIYLFKAVIERDRETAHSAGEQDRRSGHEDHH